jgi:SAM-dependent MidA family methyltransferase
LTIEDIVRERGPMTVAAFMDLALYHPQLGYYARAARRSGRAGDFLTSVDVGSIFGALLALQIEEMFDILSASFSPDAAPSVSLVEAGAGDGRLSADILRILRQRSADRARHVQLHLVEASAAARSAQRETLGDVADALVSSSPSLPASFEGVLLANELLDAFPVHQVVMGATGLQETYVVEAGGGRLETIEGPLSTPALVDYFASNGTTLEPGWRAEVSLRAMDWVRQAARSLQRGFIVIIDYGHEASELYSVSHASGTLTTFSNHRQPDGNKRGPAWLARPGERDLTAHVDFTSVRAAAEREGLQTLGFMDQTYFLLGLLAGSSRDFGSDDATSLHDRLALKTLLMPGGLGSTHKVLIFGKGVGAPNLRGCSFGQRVT